MSGETPHIDQLSYALPTRPEDGAHVHRERDAVRFELGAMPTEVFATSLIAEVLGFILCGGGLLAVNLRALDAVTWGGVSLCAIASTVSIVLVTRHRLTPRLVGATIETVFCSGPHTRGKLATLPRIELDSIDVRRSWWRPWVFELVAVPKTPGFWTLKPSTRGPVVLLLDLDHAVVTRVASELREFPAAAPTPALSRE